MYKVIIIDDNKNDLNMMKNKIINCNKLELECFQDVSKIDMNKNYDAVFIDIDMPMMNGIDFANQYKLKHAVVGRGMKSQRGTAGRVFSALAHAHINVKMIDQGSSELNIIVGVRHDEFKHAIRALYDIFVLTQI